MKKYIFVTTFIGNSVHPFEVNIDKFKDADYFLFTNFKKKDIKNTFWNVITVDINDKMFENLNKIQISRFFKFNIFKILEKYLPNNEYEYYIYCDSNYIPIYSTELINTINSSKKSTIGILQSKHLTKNISMKEEMALIVRCTKETKENIKLTEIYLKKLCNNDKLFNKILNEKKYYENCILIFDLKNNKLKNYLHNFFSYYSKYPTYRDQPLWNYLLKINNYEPETCYLRDFFKLIPRNNIHDINFYKNNIK